MSGAAWSAADLQTLRDLYPSHKTADIARLLGRGVFAVLGQAHKLGIAKTPEFLASECRLQKGHQLGRATQFSKGHVPANKGVRRPGWSAGRMRETQFKKGVRSGVAKRNWVPIGTISPDPDGYLRIKVREGQHGKEAFGFGNTKIWPLLNRYLWEQHNGPIPPKHIVAFKDGNHRHCVIENLELLSMADNARRNSMWKRLPPELARAIQLNGVLKRKLRRANGQEQTSRPAGSPVRDAGAAQG